MLLVEKSNLAAAVIKILLFKRFVAVQEKFVVFCFSGAGRRICFLLIYGFHFLLFLSFFRVLIIQKRSRIIIGVYFYRYGFFFFEQRLRRRRRFDRIWFGLLFHVPHGAVYLFRRWPAGNFYFLQFYVLLLQNYFNYLFGFFRNQVPFILKTNRIKHQCIAGPGFYAEATVGGRSSSQPARSSYHVNSCQRFMICVLHHLAAYPHGWLRRLRPPSQRKAKETQKSQKVPHKQKYRNKLII